MGKRVKALRGTWDVIVVGGGPAGLSAALILGRCLRRVLVCDAGQPRNAAAHRIHGFLTRDPIPPAELLRLGREQLNLDQYDTVELARVSVIDAARVGQRFEVKLSGGRRARARKLLVATGVLDEVPDIEGLQPLYGRSVFHCPYCDGWEVRHEFVANGCGACHTVRGTPAPGAIGPDLTHVGGRLGIGGADVLANQAGAFVKWIGQTDTVKPGVHMPAFRALPPESLSALAAYLDGLQ